MDNDLEVDMNDVIDPDEISPKEKSQRQVRKPKKYMHKDYFEGILQLREIDEEILDFVLSQFEKNDIYISKMVKLKKGYDIYSSSNKFSRKIARRLLNSYGGEIKESPTVFSRNHMTSKDVYRLNVLYRPSKFRRGEVVVNHNDVYKVTSIEKGYVIGINLMNGKKKKFDECKKLDTYDVEVVSTTPTVRVLDRENYELVDVVNPRNQKEGDLVKITIFNGDVYIV